MNISNENITPAIITPGITAVIGVKKSSTRCPNKNNRPFSDTSLLRLKISNLKQVRGISKILVSSNCDIMLGVAREMGVDTFKREEKYCKEGTRFSASNFFRNLAETISTDTFMYSPVTSPLFIPNDYDQLIDKWNEIKDTGEYDSLVTCNSLKEFIWHDNEPVNYDRYHPPSSQTLPDYKTLNFGCNILPRNVILELGNVIGLKPYFYTVDNTKGFDIDHCNDFITAELLYNNNIHNARICERIIHKRKGTPQIVDCTIRDGGYLNNWNFTDEQVLDCYRAVTESGCDYFEIGFRTNRNLLPGKGIWCYSDEEDINRIFEQNPSGCKIAVMAKIGTVNIEDFIPKSESNISLVRVLLARSTTTEDGNMVSMYGLKELTQSRDFCVSLLELGYEVCMNFGCGDLITDEEIQLIASTFHNVPIKALYLADTYGSFNESNLSSQIHKFYQEFEKYDSDISIGFHSHNNNENALAKAKTAIFHGCSMIDSCIWGLGRGAGNLKTEKLLTHLCQNNEDYIRCMKPLAFFYNKHITSKEEYNNNLYLQSHPYYMIAGMIGLHPNYINELLLGKRPVEKDIYLIRSLDKYTKENDCRNYDKNLISRLEEQKRNENEENEDIDDIGNN